jgi:hypothetical protein
MPPYLLSPEKTETNYVFTFQFFNDKIYQKPFDTWQFGKIGVLVKFTIKKLKSKHFFSRCTPAAFSLSQFSLVTGFFERTSENMLHIFLTLVQDWLSKLKLCLLQFVCSSTRSPSTSVILG